MRTALVTLLRLPVRGAIFAIELYRTYVSPMRLPTCRFMPTCSQYAVEALSEYGLVRGGWLTAVRLVKCGPWHRGGWDPIPMRHNHIHRHGDQADEPLARRAEGGDEPLARRAEGGDEPLARRAEGVVDGWGTPAQRGENKSCV